MPGALALEALRLVATEGDADRLFDRPGVSPAEAMRRGEEALSALEATGLLVITREDGGGEATGMRLTDAGREALVDGLARAAREARAKAEDEEDVGQWGCDEAAAAVVLGRDVTDADQPALYDALDAFAAAYDAAAGDEEPRQVAGWTAFARSLLGAGEGTHG